MNRRSKHPTLSLVVLLGTLAAACADSVAATDNEPFGLLFVSTYHGDEITAGDGDTYFALVRDGNGWTLASTSVRVTRIEDQILDPPGEKTGKEVQVEGVEPLFLVRGAFTPGPIETIVSQGASFYGSPSFQLKLTSGEQYRLTVACPEAPEPSPEARARQEFPDAWRQPCPLRLSHDTEEQQLADLQVNRLHESGAYLLWAGDLDRDGRLDLLIDLSGHYNISEPTLFLSSAATDGELVAPVARLTTSGC